MGDLDYISSQHHGCRVECFSQNAAEYVVLQNALLYVRFCISRGGDILELRYKKTDIDLLWHFVDSANNIPSIASAVQPQKLFFAGYPGGWQEILPGGGPYEDCGAVIGVHGEAAILPWKCEILNDDANRVSLLFTCTLHTIPLQLEKTVEIRAGEAKLFFHEKLYNKAQQEISYMWGHHPAYGVPFINEGVRLYLPASDVLACGKGYSPTSVFETNSVHTWPVFTGIDGSKIDMSILRKEHFNRTELFHVIHLREGWYALHNPLLEIGVAFAWDPLVFPHVWIWHDFSGSSGYPFWGNAHTMAVEFWNAYPNNFEAARENGSLKTLPARACKETSFVLALFERTRGITSIDMEGNIFHSN
jgi:hypothetical protein